MERRNEKQNEWKEVQLKVSLGEKKTFFLIIKMIFKIFF